MKALVNKMRSRGEPSFSGTNFQSSMMSNELRAEQFFSKNKLQMTEDTKQLLSQVMGATTVINSLAETWTGQERVREDGFAECDENTLTNIDCSDEIPERDDNYQRALTHELDQEKVTGDFEKHASDEELQLYHNTSYIDTYDPAFREDLYTNTSKPISTRKTSESDYCM